jgi:hypothetical protein
MTYHEHFDNILDACQDQKNPDFDDENFTIDLFNGLDNGHYATCKVTIINGIMT